MQFVYTYQASIPLQLRGTSLTLHFDPISYGGSEISTIPPPLILAYPEILRGILFQRRRDER